MAENKKKSQYNLITDTDVTSSTRFDVLNGAVLDNKMLIYGDLSGVTGTKGLLYKIWTSLFNVWTTETISADSNKVINLGPSATYRYIEVDYIASRGTKHKGGIISVLNTEVIARANDSCLDSADEEDEGGLGAWLKVDLYVSIGSQIPIKLITNAGDVIDTTFKYRISKRIEKIT